MNDDIKQIISSTMKEELSPLTQSIQLIVNQMGIFASTVTTLNEKVDNFSNQVVALNDRVNTLAEELSDLNEKVNTFDDKLINLSNMFDKKLSEQSQELLQEIRSLDVRLTSLEGTVIKIEYEHGRKLDLLLDYAKANIEKHDFYDSILSKHEARFFRHDVRISALEDMHLPHNT